MSNEYESINEVPSKKRVAVLLPVGTRIRFIKSLYGEATGDAPACVYAEKGDGGVVTGHGTHEGHWVKWDKWPHAFGAEYGVEFIEDTITDPLPCAFCGVKPSVFPVDPKTDGNAWGEVRCVNEDCRFSPSVSCEVGVTDKRGSDEYKRIAIERWNEATRNKERVTE